MSKKNKTAASRGAAAKPVPDGPRRPAAIAGISLGLFAAIAAVWIWTSSHSANTTSAAAASPSASASTAAPPAGPTFAGKSFPSQGHAHLAPDEPDHFVYNSNPPTSGPHKEIFSDQFVMPTPLPAYVQVHLLEHGNVLAQYNCTCPDVAASLSSIAYEYDSRLIAPNELQPTTEEVQAGEEQGKAVLVAPNPGMKARIAVTAWTRLGVLKAVDKPKIESFIRLYLGNSANASQ